MSTPGFCVANSEYTQATLEHLYPGLPSSVQYYPIETAATRLEPEDRRVARQELGATDGAAFAAVYQQQHGTSIQTHLSSERFLDRMDEGYRKAEVTGGGVALGEVNPRTMESRRHPGLFLCGEMLDAFGPIGGYNFLWAWATGRAAGLGAARPSR